MLGSLDRDFKDRLWTHSFFTASSSACSLHTRKQSLNKADKQSGCHLWRRHDCVFIQCGDQVVGGAELVGVACIVGVAELVGVAWMVGVADVVGVAWTPLCSFSSLEHSVRLIFTQT